MAMQTVSGRNGMVTARHYLAAQAGCDVRRADGNAVEACDGGVASW